jgi:cytoplasmic iron level regulating protein YaaA (DUF328/UPF0246 family)
MIFLISPAKTLDFESASLSDDFAQPHFLSEAAELNVVMRDFDWQAIGSLMKVSENIARLNVKRFLEWRRPFTPLNAKQAVYAFKGDVYTGLSVESMSAEELAYLQSHLRILSGLYGLLKPMDLMQAYRLEMGTKLNNPKGKDLYAFWGDKITELLNQQLGEDDSVLVNLASNEYYKSVHAKQINGKIITPIFKDKKNDKYKIISFYAKKARGLMVRYAADHHVKDVQALKRFDYQGYYYSEEQSTDNSWVFLREEINK